MTSKIKKEQSFNEQAADLVEKKQKLNADIADKLVKLKQELFDIAMGSVPKEISDAYSKYPKYFKTSNKVSCPSSFMSANLPQYQFVPTNDDNGGSIEVEGIEDIIEQIYAIKKILSDIDL